MDWDTFQRDYHESWTTLCEQERTIARLTEEKEALIAFVEQRRHIEGIEFFRGGLSLAFMDAERAKAVARWDERNPELASILQRHREAVGK